MTQRSIAVEEETVDGQVEEDVVVEVEPSRFSPEWYEQAPTRLEFEQQLTQVRGLVYSQVRGVAEKNDRRWLLVAAVAYALVFGFLMGRRGR